MTKHDIGHEGSKVWCRWLEGKKYVFGYYVLESDKTPPKKFEKHIDPLYSGPD